VLKLAEAVVSRICVSEHVQLVILTPSAAIDLYIAGDVDLRDQSQTYRVRLDDSSSLGAMLKLRGRRVEELGGSEDTGDLNVVLENASLAVKTAWDFEAWEIDGPGLKLIGLPGGGASVTAWAEP
jgi:hypothetical protein